MRDRFYNFIFAICIVVWLALVSGLCWHYLISR